MDKQTNKTTKFQIQELNHQTLPCNCEQTFNTPFTWPDCVLSINLNKTQRNRLEKSNFHNKSGSEKK